MSNEPYHEGNGAAWAIFFLICYVGIIALMGFGIGSTLQAFSDAIK